MKKLIAVIVIALILTSFGSRLINAQSDVLPYNQSFMMRSGDNCHSGNYERSYEWYYLHLNVDDQEILDLMYAERLVLINFDDLSSTEQKEAIKDIKERLIQYIIDEDLFGYGRS
ncbi:MAG: hypothetical protein ACNA7U_02225 [Candidatus Izemoplasmataceae bacterium]